jgi:hypothetical protein
MKRTLFSTVAGLAVLGALAALVLSACSRFEQAAATELAEDVASTVEQRADETGRSVADAAILARTLHEVVDLDDADTDRYRPHHEGLADVDGDGLDDDGHVEVVVRHERACVSLADGRATVHDGAC